MQIIHPDTVLSNSPIIPVVNINDSGACVELAHALVEAGIGIIEITLRNNSAIESIEKVANLSLDMLVGAGTIHNSDDYTRVVGAGADFAISPGLTTELVQTVQNASPPLIPGVATSSEIMTALSYGFTHLKFFPAEQIGGVALLKALSGPFSEVKFCPTGGINQNNFQQYLDLSNVSCVGGSWIIPKDAIQTHFKSIQAPIQAALAALETSQ